MAAQKRNIPLLIVFLGLRIAKLDVSVAIASTGKQSVVLDGARSLAVASENVYKERERR